MVCLCISSFYTCLTVIQCRILLGQYWGCIVWQAKRPKHTVRQQCCPTMGQPSGEWSTIVIKEWKSSQTHREPISFQQAYKSGNLHWYAFVTVAYDVEIACKISFATSELHIFCFAQYRAKFNLDLNLHAISIVDNTLIYI